MAVVFFHYSTVLGWPAPWQRVLDQGRTGVCFFYVLSGFVMAYGYERWFGKDLSRYGEYFARRMRRIVPLYLFGIFLNGIAIYRQHTGHAGVWYPSWLQPGRFHLAMLGLPISLFALQSWIPIDAIQEPWNGPGWSICCEFFFYAVFPILIFAILRSKAGRVRLANLVIVTYAAEIALCMLAGYLVLSYFNLEPLRSWSPGPIESMEVIYYRFPVMRLPEFIIGVLTGMIFSRTGQRAIPVIRVVGILSIAWILILAFGLYLPRFLQDWALGWGRWYVLYVPGFAGLILYLSSVRSWLSRLLATRWFLFGGESSYALYIVHVPLMCLYMTLVTPGYRSTVVDCLGMIALTLVFAALCHLYIERPLMGMAKRSRAPQALPATVA